MIYYKQRQSKKNPKPPLSGVSIAYTKDGADDYAEQWRKAGESARIFERDIKVDNVRLTVWVVIVRSRKNA